MCDRELQAEKVRFLFAGSPAALFASALAALIIVGVHWEVLPRPLLLGWLLIHATTLFGRTALLVSHRRDATVASNTFWLRRFRLSALAGGLSWGLGGVIFALSGDPIYQGFVAFSLAGLNAGALTGLAVDRAATQLFVIPSLAPLAVRFLLDPNRLALVMGLIVLLFLVFLAFTITRIEAYLLENVRLRVRAETQQRQIQTDETRWRIAAEDNGLSLWDWDLESDRVFYSRPWPSNLAADGQEVVVAFDEWMARIHAEDSLAVRAALEQHLAGFSPLYETEHRIDSRDDGDRWVLDRGQIVERSVDGRPIRMIGIHMDITARKLAETELRIAATVFESQEGVLVTDADEVILRVNHAFTEMTGYTSAEAVGQTPRLLKSGRHDRDFYAAMWANITASGSWTGEIWNRRKSGEVYPQWLNITAITGDDGRVTHYVATLHDITERKAAERAIQHLAFYDALTALPNRRLLLDRLNHAQIVSERTRRCGALLFIDLDRFKELNDTLGHMMGDLLLQQVASRLGAVVRDVDTVARLGGDEFVVMLEDLSSDEREARRHASEIGAKVLATLAMPYQLAEHLHHGTPSIGVILFCGQALTAEEAIKRADLAMYQAKQSGRNALCFFEQEMQASVDARAALKEELRRGLGREQFVLLYQPQVDRAGGILGAEVLLRWTNPQRTVVLPDEFIPLAEESGLIMPLGYWVLKSACAQLSVWARDPARRHLTLSVNISARQFRDVDFIDEVRAILSYSGADPRRLTLEVNENLLVQETDSLIGRMAALKALGLGLSLDNFGTGYSSLIEIKDLPLSQLKLGRPLVRDLLTDSRMALIAKSLIELGDALGLEVLAAGVETEPQLAFLQTNACRVFQGYLFSRPLTITELVELTGPRQSI